MDTKTFRKALGYGSAGLVGLVALVFSSGGLLPAKPAPAAVTSTAALTRHSQNPWSVGQSSAQSSAAPRTGPITPAPPREVYEPEDSYGAGATVDPSGAIPGEPNHSNQLPTGGMVGTASSADVTDNSDE